ncbi:alkaline phosphatase D family protein [Kitasatospora sp. NPDC058406]|uniref:alkaline phosphatase D family protein n=1 Tax=Kitasatospora sp. NPDC058406 TaxID=3346483 RepID=UPI00364967F9
MDDSSRTPSEISRRRVVQLLGAGAVMATAGTTMTGATAEAHANPWSGLVAAVLDEPDAETNARGLKTLLENAGFAVITLNPNQGVRYQAAPSTLSAANAAAAAAVNGVQEVALVAFGSFAGTLPSYSTFETGQRASLQAFVKAGGVVLDLAQPDRPGVGVPYLPVFDYQYDAVPMHAVRTDYDSNTIYPVDTNHPLVKPLAVSTAAATSGQVLTGRRTRRSDGGYEKKLWTSWESLGAWAEMRVLLSCVPGTTGFPAALVEGRHEKGRYLVSSLTIDKCYAADGTTPVESAAAIEDSHAFFNALTGYVQKVRASSAPGVSTTPSPKAGPLVGDVSETTARIWARPGVNRVAYPIWSCQVSGGAVNQPADRTIMADNDETVLFDVTGLTPDTDYTFTITCTTPDAPSVPLTGKFRTAPVSSAATKVILGVGSCAHSISNPVWKQILDSQCEGFVMLGDTPYADRGLSFKGGTPPTDTEVLTKARRTHREFLAAPGIDNLVRSMPVWGTWDDHDYGANGSDGTFVKKDLFRQVFVDYRANASFGHATNGTQAVTGRGPGEGIYTSFRRGPVEVFLIDPRWFSNSGSNPRVCMGSVQKDWLFGKLKASTAKFKLLASGMTWYDKAGPESDDWFTYQAERAELFKHIRDNNIKGCVLLSGDIHVSRTLKNHGDPNVGYDLWEFVVSPLHDKTAADVHHVGTPPVGLVDKVAEPRTFLKLEADTSTATQAKLTATWINAAGKTVIGPLVLTAAQLGY